MIARTWHGAVPADKADAYHAFLLQTGVPDYQSTPGIRGVHLLRRTEGDLVHFLLVTFWDSLDAVRAFAGDDVLRARYYPKDEDFLIEKEPFVTHYDVLSLETTHG
jgi:heme-degrading monooxygenase HmoA